MTKQPAKKKYKVHSLERGLDLMEILAQGEPERSLTELSQEAGFNPTTTHRILGALKLRGYVKQDPSTSKYRLTLKLFELGGLVVRHLDLRREAGPVLRELAGETGESAYLIIRDGDEAICIERIDGHNYVKVLFLQVGGRMPLHIGAGPKVILAHLDRDEAEAVIGRRGLKAWTEFSLTSPQELFKELEQIREQGYALSVEDVTLGAGAVGCPVRDWKGEVVAAVSISGVAGHFRGESLKRMAGATKAAADRLSARLHSSS